VTRKPWRRRLAAIALPMMPRPRNPTSISAACFLPPLPSSLQSSQARTAHPGRLRPGQCSIFFMFLWFFFWSPPVGFSVVLLCLGPRSGSAGGVDRRRPQGIGLSPVEHVDQGNRLDRAGVRESVAIGPDLWCSLGSVEATRQTCRPHQLGAAEQRAPRCRCCTCHACPGLVASPLGFCFSSHGLLRACWSCCVHSIPVLELAQRALQQQKIFLPWLRRLHMYKAGAPSPPPLF
jgi:hypothetical protein